MIYRLLVNVAFLAAGYYIGKEVGRLSALPRHSGPGQSPQNGVQEDNDDAAAADEA